MTDTLTPAEWRARQKPSKARKSPTTRTAAPAPPPSAAQGAEETRKLAGVPGCQVGRGATETGSVLRFFNLGPDDKAALLACAAERGIHPVR